MNIFHVHRNPNIAATMLCDKHVVKMILESAQMLATVNHKYGVIATYKATHAKHPSTLWVAESKANYEWLKEHGLALCLEYTNRYKKIHKTEIFFHTEFANPPEGIPDIGLTEFVQTMPDEYKDADPVIAYRKYYLGAKKSFAVWKYSDAPMWFIMNDPFYSEEYGWY